MKILWVSPFFLHPTDRGGQIRTLGTLKELHKRHEIHFAALNKPENLEGPRMSGEYSTQHTAVEHTAPKRGSAAMLPQLASSLVSNVPLAISRYHSAKLKAEIATLAAVGRYDSIVCDFLTSVPNMPDLGRSILFQHNVETTIWRRHAEQAQSPLKRQFFSMQARKMEAYERRACQESKYVIAVSEIDASRMRQMFSIDHVASVPTGVDVEYFRKPAENSLSSDIVFCGSMDWLPNVDAMEHFLSEILPLIREKRPATTVTIAGRSPDPRVKRAAEGLEAVVLTGNVPDMRPYLWASRISVVPIRIGGGTRLKIYECMAADLPVISTTVGAEGLSYTDGRDILIADSPRDFAGACLRLLNEEDAHEAMAHAARRLVEEKFSWGAVSRDFEDILERHRLSN